MFGSKTIRKRVNHYRRSVNQLEQLPGSCNRLLHSRPTISLSFFPRLPLRLDELVSLIGHVICKSRMQTGNLSILFSGTRVHLPFFPRTESLILEIQHPTCLSSASLTHSVHPFTSLQILVKDDRIFEKLTIY